MLVTPGDAPELAAQLTKLLADPERRAAMGAAGRRRVEEHFDASLMARRVENVYTLVRSSPDRASARPREWTVQDLQSPERTAAMREALEHDGFVVLRDVVRKDRLQELAGEIFAEFDRATAAGELFEGGGQLTGHLNCFPGRDSQFVYDDLTEHGIIDFVREVRPDIVDYVRATLNFNLPGSVPQHYHSDGLYVEEFLICNVAVVDTDLENGAIDVLPGTNREFYKFWRYAVERKYRLTTRVPLRQGDVILRKSTLWHRGMPNKTPTPRPMMAVTFGEVRGRGPRPVRAQRREDLLLPELVRDQQVGPVARACVRRCPAHLLDVPLREVPLRQQGLRPLVIWPASTASAWSPSRIRDCRHRSARRSSGRTAAWLGAADLRPHPLDRALGGAGEVARGVRDTPLAQRLAGLTNGLTGHPGVPGTGDSTLLRRVRRVEQHLAADAVVGVLPPRRRVRQGAADVGANAERPGRGTRSDPAG